MARFGAWLEQLIAESTGKHGVGIVPIAGEPLGRPGGLRRRPRLRPPRARRRGAPGRRPTGPRRTSCSTRSPRRATRSSASVVADPIDLAAEFVRWEVATAIAGAVLGINPFDEPNVTESKENTRRVLADLERTGPFPGRRARSPTGDGLAVYGDTTLRLTAGDGTRRRASSGATSPGSGRTPTSRSRPSSPRPTPGRAALDRIRARPPRRHRPGDDGGFGPRFLHSTGQLHKGGAPIGWFLQLTADHPVDVAIPGKPYTFGQLIDAQAIGDFEALEAHDLPVLRVHLGADVDAGLAALEAAVQAALA